MVVEVGTWHDSGRVDCCAVCEVRAEAEAGATGNMRDGTRTEAAIAAIPKQAVKTSRPTRLDCRSFRPWLIPTYYARPNRWIG